MTRTIWHLGGLTNFNHGDAALQSATKKIIKERCRDDINFVHIDTQRTFFSKYLIDKMNNEADMLVVGGGGFIFYRPPEISHSGWQFNISKENIDKIKIPIVVYGIGNNKFPHDKDDFPQSMWQNIQAVIDRSAVFSVRNTGTLISMRDNGVCVDKVDVVPDAAVFVDPFPFNHPCLNTGKFKIGLNFATDRWQTRFKDELSALNALDASLYACKHLVKKYDAKIYLLEHLYYNDMNKTTKPLIRGRAKQVLGDDVCIVSDEVGDELYPSFGYLSGMFVDIYRQMDIMIGMRGHSNIIAFGQNTPCIGIGEHKKVLWFLEEVGMTNAYVPLNTDIEQDKKSLIDIAEKIVENLKTHKLGMAKKKNEISVIKDAFVDRIIDVL